MKTALSILALLLVLVSCNTPRYAYSPSAHNVPILAKQGDSKIAAYYSNNGFSPVSEDDNEYQYDKSISHGADLQGAIAVTNHFAVQANYYFRSEKSNSVSFNNTFDSSKVRYRRNLIEGGLGYFTPLDTKQRILFQVFAGAGVGSTKITDVGTTFNQTPYSRYYNADLTKIYLEPAITFRAKEVFAASVASRFSLVKFRNISSNYSLFEKQDLNLDSLDRFPVVFFEPTFVGSFGFNKLPGFRIEIQTGLSILWDESFIDYRPFNFSLGLVCDIRKLIKGPGN